MADRGAGLGARCTGTSGADGSLGTTVSAGATWGKLVDGMTGAARGIGLGIDTLL